MIENQQCDVVSNRTFEWKKWSVFLLLVIIGIIVSIFFLWKTDFFRKLRSIDTNVEKNELVQKTEIPEDNFVVFTRCFNGKRQPQYCNLYVSSLSEYEEKLVYTFDFPDVENTEFEASYQFKIVGVVGRKIIYKKNYWKKNDGVVNDIQVLGVLDMRTLENRELHNIVNSLESNILTRVYYIEHLDTINNKLYFSVSNMADGADKVNKILAYDLINNEETIVADTNTLDDRYIILGSSKTKLFLSKIVETGVNDIWNRTLDLEKGTLDREEPNLWNPVFDGPGERLLYLQTEKTSNTTENICLIYKKINEAQIQEVYCLRNRKIPQMTDIVQNYRYIGDYFLNIKSQISIGDWVSFSVITEKDMREKLIERYIYRLGNPDSMVLEMYKNGKMGKDFYETYMNSFKLQKVILPNKPYRWTLCTENADFAEIKRTGQCTLFKKYSEEGPNTWYLGGFTVGELDDGHDSFINNSERIGEWAREIVISGENVFVVAEYE